MDLDAPCVSAVTLRKHANRESGRDVPKGVSKLSLDNQGCGSPISPDGAAKSAGLVRVLRIAHDNVLSSTGDCCSSTTFA
jgi:hypothetical protein